MMREGRPASVHGGCKSYSVSLDARQTGGSRESTGSLGKGARRGTQIIIPALILLPGHLEFHFQPHSTYLRARGSTLTSTTWFARLTLRKREREQNDKKNTILSNLSHRKEVGEDELTSSPFFPEGPGGPRGPMAPCREKQHISKVSAGYKLSMRMFSDVARTVLIFCRLIILTADPASPGSPGGPVNP